LDLTDEDKVWAAAIREYKFQVARSVAASTDAERGDRLLWTLIQIGLSTPQGERLILNDHSVQVRRYAAVGLSRVMRKVDSEKERLDNLCKHVKQVEEVMYECDKATTVCPVLNKGFAFIKT
jgi:hypothetical protein